MEQLERRIAYSFRHSDWIWVSDPDKSVVALKRDQWQHTCRQTAHVRRIADGQNSTYRRHACVGIRMGSGAVMNRSLRETFELLGVVDERLPDAGIAAKVYKTAEFGEVKIWVEPRVGKTHFIRTRCACPYCDREVAYARLPQHAATWACLGKPNLLKPQAG